MPAQPFVHIHNHTEYSLLDGANRVSDLVKRAAQMDMPAVAISDHGVMFGVMEFYLECKKQGIKPLIGMEAYVAPNGLHNKQGRAENQTYHLLLLARNKEGYQNLCKLHSIAALQGFYYKPRIDHELLRAHAGGLIGTSACLGSEICQELMAKDYARAQYLAGLYKEIFDEGCFFIELQDHRLKEQAAIREPLLRIARELKLETVATNDAHYLCKGDDKAHDVLLCIGTNALLQQTDRLRFETDEFYLKSAEEMEKLFGDVPAALENTLRIAEMCDLELGQSRALMPEPDKPEGIDSPGYLEQLALTGLEERRGRDEESEARLRYELDVIRRTGFDDYFLLVREFADFTRRQGIAFGVRGSAAGSLVSYCLGITDVDPLEYDLTFERFLNPERVSMPDIDMDFEDERRDEVIRWVTQKYGQERVAQIVTFGTLGPKQAIRDAGRVMGYTPQETDRICKTIPNVPGTTLDKALAEIADFRHMVSGDPRVSELVTMAKEIEGLARHPGVHAAGVVISREPLMEHVPLYRGNDGQAITAYDMGSLEKIGLLKMDFLGLSNLTVLARCVKMVEESTGKRIDLARLPLDDKPTYDMLSRGETVGVFQLESGGMRRHIVELKPTSVRELAAMVALYRPGPMAHIPRYIDTKHGRLQPSYLHPLMEPILRETYGVIVYQDQVLKLVQALAGFSLGKADILRRAMGKKDAAAMASMKAEFDQGCAEHEVPAETAEQVWELLLPFAGYAFNKAHAVCYALIAYQTAYLKAHHPVEYMAALLAVYRTKEDRVVTFIEECRRQKIAVLPPDVNRSSLDFTIEEGQAIRFGLAAIKGIGEGLVNALIEERGGAPSDAGYKPYTHLYEFAERTKAAGMNRSALEALIKAGALASIEPNRSALLAVADGALVFADNARRNREAGQDSLFGGAESEACPTYPRLEERPALSRGEVLAYERETMGIYLSDHPLRGYERVLPRLATLSCAGALEAEEGTSVKLAGVIASLRIATTKQTGKKMASLILEDFSGQIACTVFPGPYEKLRDKIEKDRVVAITGVLKMPDRVRAGGEAQLELRVDDVEFIAEPPSQDDGDMAGIVEIRIVRASVPELEQLRDLLRVHPGEFGVSLRLGYNGGLVDTPYRVTPTPAFIDAVKAILPTASVTALAASWRPGSEVIAEAS